MQDYNILLMLMSLQIGGAETHAVELAKGLKAQGYNVIVASAGGIFLKELEDCQIKHYEVPLHNKKIGNVIKSYNMIKKIVLDEKIDLIHAHARIPAVIAGRVAKKNKIPFVTTAHGIRRTGLIWKYITNWGQKVVAVSTDVKKDLINTYGVEEKDIIVTINGIDTEKFSPDVKAISIIEQMGLNPNKKRIVYISRLDMDRKTIIEQIMDTMVLVKNKYANIELVIVGNGDAYSELGQKANSINALFEEQTIFLAGETTETNKYIASADIFIGFGRSSLEALSSAKPTIIASPYGYTGIFTSDKLDICLMNNFSCRGEYVLVIENMSEDILMLLAKDEAELKQIGNYGRNIIKEKYSNEIMIANNEEAYKQLLNKHKKYYDVIISGYYGFENSGDDAILSAIIIELRKRMANINILVLSNNPETTKMQYKVDTIKRTGLFIMLKHMRHAKLFINGGGSLIQDITSSRSIIYYLGITYIAHLSGMKTMLYANGIGPINKKRNRRITKYVLNKCKYITLREQKSADELKNLGVNNPIIEVTADPALNLNPCSIERAIGILDENKVSIQDAILGFSIRDWKKSEDFVPKLAKLADEMSKKYNAQPVFLCLQYPKDIAIAERIISYMKTDAKIIRNKCSAEEMIGLISQMKLLVGMRLHALIYSASVGVSAVGLVYDPKIGAFVDYVEQVIGGDVECLDYDVLFEKTEQEWTKGKANNKDKQQKLKVLAVKNADIAIDILNSKN